MHIEDRNAESLESDNANVRIAPHNKPLPDPAIMPSCDSASLSFGADIAYQPVIDDVSMQISDAVEKRERCNISYLAPQAGHVRPAR